MSMKANPKLILIGGIASLCLLNGCVVPNNNSGYNQTSVNQQIQQDSEEIAEMRSNLAKELPSYSSDYLKRVVQVLGACQKTMESPRFMMSSARSDASSQLDNLKLDFPQQRTSVANRELEVIIDKIGAIINLGEPDDYPSGRFGYLAAAEPLTDYVNNAIKAMHDTLLN